MTLFGFDGRAAHQFCPVFVGACKHPTAAEQKIGAYFAFSIPPLRDFRKFHRLDRIADRALNFLLCSMCC